MSSVIFVLKYPREKSVFGFSFEWDIWAIKTFKFYYGQIRISFIYHFIYHFNLKTFEAIIIV